jgi:hypothetical protein
MHHHSCDRVVDGHLTSLLDRLNSADALDDETGLDTPGKTQVFNPDQPEPDNNATDAVEAAPDPDHSDDVNSVLSWLFDAPLSLIVVAGLGIGFSTSLAVAGLFSPPDKIVFASRTVEIELTSAIVDEPRDGDTMTAETDFPNSPDGSNTERAVLNLVNLQQPSGDTRVLDQSTTAQMMSFPRFLMPLQSRRSPFPIEVSDADGSPDKMVLILSGFPAGVTFTQGRPLGDSIWALRVTDAQILGIDVAESVRDPFKLRGDLLMPGIGTIPHDTISVHLADVAATRNFVASMAPSIVASAGTGSFAKGVISQIARVPQSEKTRKKLTQIAALGSGQPEQQVAKPVTVTHDLEPSRRTRIFIPPPERNIQRTIASARIVRRKSSFKRIARRRLSPRHNARINKRFTTKSDLAKKQAVAKRGYNGLTWNPFPVTR